MIGRLAEDPALWLHELAESIRIGETAASEQVADFVDSVLDSHAQKLVGRLIEDVLGTREGPHQRE
ncbi:MAG TPA: hypothetical protein VFW80_06945 [Gaiellaceae bacterium]|nr:hypothetical protein [Gaiellaceae bacterium]